MKSVYKMKLQELRTNEGQIESDKTKKSEPKVDESRDDGNDGYKFHNRVNY